MGPIPLRIKGCIACTSAKGTFRCASRVTIGWRISLGTSRFWFLFPESVCEGFFVKKTSAEELRLIYIFTSSPLHIHILTCISAHLHIYIHNCTSTSLLIFTSSHLHLTSLPLIYISHLHLSLFLTFSLKAGGSTAGAPRNATLCGDRACRANEMQARVRFVPVRRDPLRRSCVSSARNAGESAIWFCRGQPSAEIVRVEGAKRRICTGRGEPSAEIVRVRCAKCRRECDLSRSGATLCGDRACRLCSTTLVRGAICGAGS